MAADPAPFVGLIPVRFRRLAQGYRIDPPVSLPSDRKAKTLRRSPRRIRLRRSPPNSFCSKGSRGHGNGWMMTSIGPLCHRQLTQDHGTSALKPINNCGVMGCHETFIDGRASTGWGIGRKTQVFYPDGNAMECSLVNACGYLECRLPAPVSKARSPQT